MKVRHILFPLVMIAACSEQSPDAPPSDTVAQENRSDVNHSCCFTSEQEFLDFFPQDSSADFLVNRSLTKTAINCPNDTLQISFCTQTYLNSEGNEISVRLSDYCALSSARIDTAYYGLLRSYKADPSGSEFNEFEMPDSYFGFSCYLPANRLATLTLVVDHRFLVEIVHHRAQNTKSVVKMLDHIPVERLKKVKR